MLYALCISLFHVDDSSYASAQLESNRFAYIDLFIC